MKKSTVKRKTTTTISVDDDFKTELTEEGKRNGIPFWTMMMQVLAREGLEARKVKRNGT